MVCFLYIHKWRKEGASGTQQAETREAAKYHFKQRTVPPFRLQRPNSKAEGAWLSIRGPAEVSIHLVLPLKHHHRHSDPILLSIDVPPLMHRTREDRIRILLRACSPYSVSRSSQCTSRAVSPDGKSHHEMMHLAEKPQTLSESTSIACYQFSAIS